MTNETEITDVPEWAHRVAGRSFECSDGERLEEALKIAWDALECLRAVCDDEIKARSAGLSEAKLKNMRVLSLLIVPRNMAKNALDKIREIGNHVE